MYNTKKFFHKFTVGNVAKIYPFEDKDVFVSVRITAVTFRFNKDAQEVRYNLDHTDEDTQAKYGSYEDFAEHKLNNPNT